MSLLEVLAKCQLKVVCLFQGPVSCFTCKVSTSNLWLCLVGSCQYVGCGESYSDHSSAHSEVRYTLNIQKSYWEKLMLVDCISTHIQ